MSRIFQWFSNYLCSLIMRYERNRMRKREREIKRVFLICLKNFRRVVDKTWIIITHWDESFWQSSSVAGACYEETTVDYSIVKQLSTHLSTQCLAKPLKRRHLTRCKFIRVLTINSPLEFLRKQFLSWFASKFS